MTSVLIITEDKTGGGLEAVLRAEAQHRRQSRGKTPLHFLQRFTVNGNAQLLDQCRKYENLRFNYRPRIDHVFYVIDARNAWNLPQLGVQAPREPYAQSLPPFISAIQTSMSTLARGGKPEEQWATLRDGFHPHVLVWERETLILPVTDRLGLGEPISDVCAKRDAADIVKECFGRTRTRTRGYAKAIDGPQYLQRIAQEEPLRSVVFESNRYLHDIVEDLASL
jgi:hypothetical protein